MNLQAVVKQIVNDEGFRATVYDDATGKPLGILPSGGRATIGYGFECSVDGLTVAESMLILYSRIQSRIKELDLRLPWWKQLDDMRQGVLMNMAYNLGVSGLLGFQKMLTALEAKDYATAAKEGRNSLWYQQVGARGVRLMRELETGQP